MSVARTDGRGGSAELTVPLAVMSEAARTLPPRWRRRLLARFRAAVHGVAILGAACCVAGSLSASALASPKHARRHHGRHAAAARAIPYGDGARDPYAATASKPDCRYPDGTPFDPDIIGGANHVGDGGPAVNLGGFPPCGY